MTSVEDVYEHTARYFDMSVDAMLATTRVARIVWARHIAMYLIRERVGLSYPLIAAHMSKDHTTILHGVRRVMRTPEMRAQAAEIAKNFKDPAPIAVRRKRRLRNQPKRKDEPCRL